MHWLRHHQRLRASLFLGLSFAMALIVGVIVWTSITRTISEIEYWRDHDEHVTVIVAARTLGQGHPIGADDIALREVPLDYVGGAEAIRDPARVIQRIPMERILPGEPIREARLAPVERGDTMAALVPRGMRAITVNLKDAAALSGFLEPNNWVDVLVTMQGEDGRPAETVTLLQVVRVLTVDDRRSEVDERKEKRRRKPAVTLLVTPEDAEKLTHAVARGEVDLVLRSDVDARVVGEERARVD